MGPLDAEGVQQAGGVVGHVSQRVGGHGYHPCGGRRDHIRDARIVEPGGQTHIAIVETDDVETPRHQLVDEVVFPRDQLSSEAHDEQERRVGRIAGRLVFDLYPVGGDVGHEGRRYPCSFS